MINLFRRATLSRLRYISKMNSAVCQLMDAVSTNEALQCSALSKNQRKKMLKLERKAELKQKEKIKKIENKRMKQIHTCPQPSTYYIDNGLRKVWPYYHSYTANVKRRWIGRNLVDLLSQEFQFAVYDYSKRIASGHILVNGTAVPPTYTVRDGDVITHSVHRHESPVTADSIDVIHEDDDFLVVNKPASIPVHPCGRYNMNSLIQILRHELGHDNLRSTYRLDRLTSGLIIFGKTYDAAARIHADIAARRVSKAYVCRVAGVFPGGGGDGGDAATVVRCDAPIATLSPALGLMCVQQEEEGEEEVDDSGRGKAPPGDVANGDAASDEATCTHPEATAVTDDKSTGGGDHDSRSRPQSALTEFRLRATNGRESIVECRPHTGRTHQIRVHLQWLGHPVVNDPLYRGEAAWGREEGRGGRYGKTRQQLLADLMAAHAPPPTIDKSIASGGHSSCESSTVTLASAGDGAGIDDGGSTPLSPVAKRARGPAPAPASAYDAECRVCQSVWPDPSRESLCIYLHAYRYSGSDWAFETPMPKWADEFV